MNIYIVWNEHEGAIEEVSSTSENAIQYAAFFNDYSKGNECESLGPFVIDENFALMANSNKAICNPASMNISAEQEAQNNKEDAYIRAMGHDPEQYKQRKATRKSHFDTDTPAYVPKAEEIPIPVKSIKLRKSSNNFTESVNRLVQSFKDEDSDVALLALHMLNGGTTEDAS